MFVFNVGYVLISIVCIALAVYHTRQYGLDKTLTCNGMYGAVFKQLERVQSGMSCATECADDPLCASGLYNTVTKQCKLNNETWPNPTTSGCTTDTVYFINRGLLKPVCNPGNSCTNPLHGIRLCDGGGSGVCDPKQGRLEVFHQFIWGTVCDDYWGDSDYDYTYYNYNTNISYDYENSQANVDVLCRMIGYTNGTAFPEAFFGEGTGTTWLDNVYCSGNETSLYHCPANAWGDENCGHFEDVGVSCD